MPLYEYLCEKCGSKFELIEKFSAEPKTVHDGCGGKVERLISAPAFHLKGSGWYATDYAKPGASSAASEAKKAGENKSSDSKDSKDSKESKDSKQSKSSESAPASATPSTAPAPSSSPDSSKS